MTTSWELITIQGYVDALSRTSHRDEAAKVAVISDKGNVYRVLHKAAGVDLVDHISANIEVTGTATALPATEGGEQEGEHFSMLVRSYKLRDDYENPWYDDSAE